MFKKFNKKLFIIFYLIVKNKLFIIIKKTLINLKINKYIFINLFLVQILYKRFILKELIIFNI